LIKKRGEGGIRTCEGIRKVVTKEATPRRSAGGDRAKESDEVLTEGKRGRKGKREIVCSVASKAG